jgi:hypothetical protein
MNTIIKAFQKTPRADSRTLLQRLHDALIVAAIGKRTVIANADLHLAKPIQLPKRGIVFGLSTK